MLKPMTNSVIKKYNACLGADPHEYICLNCNLTIHTNAIQAGIGKGVWYLDEKILICPVCSSKEKIPTEKITVEELKEKKKIIKNRISK